MVNEYKDFLAWMNNQNFSDCTKRVYARFVREFLAGIDLAPGTQPVNEAAEKHIHELESSGNRNTLKCAVAALRQYCRFSGQPEMRLQKQTVPVMKPKCLSRDQRSLLEEHMVRINSPKAVAIARIFLATGIKCKECTDLNMNALRVVDTKIEIRLENSKRAVQLDDTTTQALLRWLEERRMHGVEYGETALFTNHSGTRISSAGVDFLLKQLGKEIGLVLSAQVLRDTYLKKTTVETRDPKSVAKQMGYRTVYSQKRIVRCLSSGEIKHIKSSLTA